MMFAAKILVAATLISFASWLAGKRPELAGFIIALPLTTMLALAFSFAEYRDPAASVTFAKSGPADLTLTAANIGGSGFDANVTFEARGGRLIGVHGSNPFDQGNLQIAGGELVLAGAVSDVPVSFGNPVNVASNGTITAGPGNTGTTGVAVTLGGSVTLGGNTLTLRSSDADGYTLGLTPQHLAKISLVI